MGSYAVIIPHIIFSAKNEESRVINQEIAKSVYNSILTSYYDEENENEEDTVVVEENEEEYNSNWSAGFLTNENNGIFSLWYTVEYFFEYGDGSESKEELIEVQANVYALLLKFSMEKSINDFLSIEQKDIEDSFFINSRFETGSIKLIDLNKKESALIYINNDDNLNENIEDFKKAMEDNSIIPVDIESLIVNRNKVLH